MNELSSKSGRHLRRKIKKKKLKGGGGGGGGGGLATEIFPLG